MVGVRQNGRGRSHSDFAILPGMLCRRYLWSRICPARRLTGQNGVNETVLWAGFEKELDLRFNPSGGSPDAGDDYPLFRRHISPEQEGSELDPISRKH
jgi:hypothetical protein